jgi:hypothetical protein
VSKVYSSINDEKSVVHAYSNQVSFDRTKKVDLLELSSDESTESKTHVLMHNKIQFHIVTLSTKITMLVNTVTI